MSTLHTVNKSPFANQSLISCLGHCKNSDAVLMFEDGVYGEMGGTGLTEIMAYEVNGTTVEHDEEGYITNLSEWSKELADVIAKAEDVEMNAGKS